MRLTKNILEQYGFLELEIERLEKKIDYYSNYCVPSEHGVVKGSMREYPFAEKHFVLSGSDVKKDDIIQDKIKQLLITLTEKKEQFIRLALDVEIELESIEDIEMRQMLELHYVQRLSYREMGAKLNMDSSTICKKVTAFLEEDSVVAR